MTTQKLKFFSLASWGEHPIGQEPGLEDCEVETVIYWSKSSEFATVGSNDAAIVRALKELPFFKVDELMAIKAGRGLQIVYAGGKIPIGAVSVKTPRSTNDAYRVISGKAKAESTRERSFRSLGRGVMAQEDSPIAGVAQ